VECPNCGREAFAEAVYCTSCGSALNAKAPINRQRSPVPWKVDSPAELVVCILILIAVNSFFFYLIPFGYEKNNNIANLMTWILPLVILDLGALWVLRNWIKKRRNSYQSLWIIVLLSAFYTWFLAAAVYEAGFMGYWVGNGIIAFTALIVYGIRSTFFD